MVWERYEEGRGDIYEYREKSGGGRVGEWGSGRGKEVEM